MSPAFPLANGLRGLESIHGHGHLDDHVGVIHEIFEAGGRIRPDRRVPLVASPDQILVMVCGGMGNLHALALHTFGPTKSQTVPF